MSLKVDPYTLFNGETRLQILSKIYENEKKYESSKSDENENYCQELSRKTYKTVSTVFQHLSILEEAGILRKENNKRGNMVVYVFTDEGKEAYINFIKKQR